MNCKHYKVGMNKFKLTVKKLIKCNILNIMQVLSD